MFFIVIIAYFGCHGTNDQRGEYLNLLGKNIRTSRLAKISTIIQKDQGSKDQNQFEVGKFWTDWFEDQAVRGFLKKILNYEII